MQETLLCLARNPRLQHTSEMLREVGYRVISAESVPSARSLVQLYRPALIVADSEVRDLPELLAPLRKPATPVLQVVLKETTSDQLMTAVSQALRRVEELGFAP